MSKPTTVPPTFRLKGDDAVEALRSAKWTTLAKDSVNRFRAADGVSHTRSIAFQIALASFPGVIAFVGYVTYFNLPGLRKIFLKTALSLAPGPAGQIFQQAFHQGLNDARTTGLLALVVGSIGTLTATTSAMAQIERGANRIYGIAEDRPFLKKYGLGFVMAVTAGSLSVIAFILFILGGPISSSAPSAGWSDATVTAWKIARWPIGILLIIAAIAIILRYSPNRHQPQFSWLAAGAIGATLCWIVVTLLLALYLGIAKDFGETYGPIAGILGLLFWSFLTSMALLLGIAFAAELEEQRARARG